MTSVQTSLTLFLLLLVSTVSASEWSRHDTPDDFVERAVAVLIRDRQIEISVQIGINAKTMRDKLATWDISEEYENETDLTNRFCEEIRHRLLEKFELRLDGEPLELEVTNVDPFAEHHKTAVMKLVAQIPEEVTGGQITFQDSSFMKLDGAVRYAIKGRGTTLVTKSNVAPIIIRADRVELGPLDAEQRLAACLIDAKLKIISR